MIISCFLQFLLLLSGSKPDPIVGIIILVILLFVFGLKAMAEGNPFTNKSSSKQTEYNEPSFVSHTPSSDVPTEKFEIHISKGQRTYKNLGSENNIEISQDEFRLLINKQIGKKGLCQLNYYLSESDNEKYQRLIRLLETMKNSQMIWLIESVESNHSPKLHSNAKTIISRRTTSIVSDSHPFIETNIKTLTVDLVSKKICFLPDSIFVFLDKFYILWKYEKYNFSINPKRFIEEGFCPSDTKIVDYTWKHLNKNGSPDLRYQSNSKIPVVIYPEFQIHDEDEVKLHLQLSNSSFTADEWHEKAQEKKAQEEKQHSNDERGAYKAACDLLGVQQGASVEEIKIAYRSMSLLYHPDKVTHLAPEFRELAETRMKAINSAYETLKKEKPDTTVPIEPNQKKEKPNATVHNEPIEMKVNEIDKLYYEALSIVTGMGRGSTSVLQRRLSISYGKAASLLDQMEKDGFIGSAEGSKPRKVLQKAYDFRSQGNL